MVDTHFVCVSAITSPFVLVSQHVGVTLAGDVLSSSIGYNVTTRFSEGWSGVPADHMGPMEDLHNCTKLFPPWK
jgi:hypothetical protein